MKEVCYDVEIEPVLQSSQRETFNNSTTTTEYGARLDIKANGLWDSRFSRTFLTKIFHPTPMRNHAPTTSKRNTNIHFAQSTHFSPPWSRAMHHENHEKTRKETERKERTHMRTP